MIIYSAYAEPGAGARGPRRPRRRRRRQGRAGVVAARRHPAVAAGRDRAPGDSARGLHGRQPPDSPTTTSPSSRCCLAGRVASGDRRGAAHRSRRDRMASAAHHRPPPARRDNPRGRASHRPPRAAIAAPLMGKFTRALDFLRYLNRLAGALQLARDGDTRGCRAPRDAAEAANLPSRLTAGACVLGVHVRQNAQSLSSCNARIFRARAASAPESSRAPPLESAHRPRRLCGTPLGGRSSRLRPSLASL